MSSLMDGASGYSGDGLQALDFKASVARNLYASAWAGAAGGWQLCCNVGALTEGLGSISDSLVESLQDYKTWGLNMFFW